MAAVLVPGSGGIDKVRGGCVVWGLEHLQKGPYSKSRCQGQKNSLQQAPREDPTFPLSTLLPRVAREAPTRPLRSFLLRTRGHTRSACSRETPPALFPLL